VEESNPQHHPHSKYYQPTHQSKPNPSWLPLVHYPVLPSWLPYNGRYHWTMPPTHPCLLHSKHLTLPQGDSPFWNCISERDMHPPTCLIEYSTNAPTIPIGTDNFLTKMMQTTSMQLKGQKWVDYVLWSWSCEKQENAQRNGTSWSPWGSWWTKFHCGVHPYGHAWVSQGCSDENLLLWVLNKLKLKVNWSGLKASLEAWILSTFE